MILRWNIDEGWKCTEIMRSTAKHRGKNCFRNRFEHQWSQTAMGDHGRNLTHTQKRLINTGRVYLFNRQSYMLHPVPRVFSHCRAQIIPYYQSKILWNIHYLAKSIAIVTYTCVWMGSNPYSNIYCSGLKLNSWRATALQSLAPTSSKSHLLGSF